MKTAKSDKSELAFYVQQAQSLQGEITIPILISELRVGHRKATEIFERLKGMPGIELAITPEPEPVGLNVITKTSESGKITAEPMMVSGLPKIIPLSAESSISLTKNENPATDDSIELAIVEAACQPMNLGQSLGEILRDFDLGPNLTQCRPLEGTSDLKIGRGLTVLTGVRNWTELGIGDLIVELKNRGYQNVIPQIISFLNLEDSHSTLDKYERVARNVPNDLRELPGLHFTHLSEAGCSRFSKDEDEQKKAIRDVLMEASEKSLNVSQTRELCLAKKGKSTIPTPSPAQKKHGRFIVVFASSCTDSITCDELPDATEDHIVIDLESASIACSGCSAGVPVWSPLIYEKLPATESEPVVEE